MKSEPSKKNIFQVLKKVLAEAGGYFSFLDDEQSEETEKSHPPEQRQKIIRPTPAESAGQHNDRSAGQTFTPETVERQTSPGLPLPSPASDAEKTYAFEEAPDPAAGELERISNTSVRSSGSAGNMASANHDISGVPGREIIIQQGERSAMIQAQDTAVAEKSSWQDEMLLLLPELHELTDRGNFMTGRQRNEIPELHDIQEKLSEAGNQLERIGHIIDKLEQEYRT